MNRKMNAKAPNIFGHAASCVDVGTGAPSAMLSSAAVVASATGNSNATPYQRGASFHTVNPRSRRLKAPFPSIPAAIMAATNTPNGLIPPLPRSFSPTSLSAHGYQESRKASKTNKANECLLMEGGTRYG